MRILIVDGSNYVDFPPGGIKFYTRNFVKAIGDDYTVSLVGITTDSNEEIGKWTYATLNGKHIPFLPVYYVDNRNGFHKKPFMPIRLGVAWGIWKRKCKINISEFDIVYVHFPELVFPFILFKKKIKVALHLHGTIREAVNKSRYKWIRNIFIEEIYYRITKWVIKQSDVVFTISQEGLELIKSIVSERNNCFHCVPVMVDTSLFYPMEKKSELRKKYGFPAEARIIIFTGRLEPKKQVDMLLEYFELLSSEDKKARLIIVGSGSDYERLNLLAKTKNIMNKVSFIGEIEHDSMLPEVLNCADVYAFTSSSGEGFPASVVEALACGIPVLSHDLGDIGKVVINGQTGYLLRPGDFHDFKEKLHLIFENQFEFSKNAYLKAQEYSIYSIANRISKVMEESIS